MELLTKLQNWLLKRIQAEDYATLTSRRIYILPTREGIIYAVLILVMLAAAINFNNSLVFFFTFLMAGMGIISMHMTQQNLLGLQFSIAHVQPVFCFQNLNLPLTISQSDAAAGKYSSYKYRRVNYSIAIELTDQALATQSTTISTSEVSQYSQTLLKQLADVRHNEETILQLSNSTVHRGYFKLPPLTISTRFPLGLFRAWANIELNNNAIVYPFPAHQANHEPQTGSDSEGQGATGRGFDDFSGFKSYQPGESLKHIHWKAYAKEQPLLTKTFSGSNNREYWINWDELSGDIEKRLSRLSRLVLDAEQCGDRYGLLLPGKTININQGQTHQHQCLKALALYRL